MTYHALISLAALYCVCFGISAASACAQRAISSTFKLPRVKYSGGGDWYNDPSAEINLLRFVQEKTGISTEPVFEPVDLSSNNIFLYPILFLTGHGTVNFSEREVRNLRAYLENGGFLYIDDDYGLDASIRKEMRKVFPEQQFVELPFSHGIYSIFYKFPNGMPKTHEHDGKPPQGFGLFHKGRLCVFYTYESNPSDGWADPTVHNDPPEKREEALRFGVNI
ncbi:MAG: DUF4159 domain-containing protein, partial [Bacteroidota bacterium]|nr:DUF4159 domain-containing protein [Candidatus Kapabacteria bacterium]MDW8221282.1 DUF4159 domain-containing protein [Bacteroidota bacterium]